MARLPFAVYHLQLDHSPIRLSDPGLKAMAFILEEHTEVELRVDIPELRLLAGTVGVIVHVYPGGKAYEVEFDGNSVGVTRVETLRSEMLLPHPQGQ